MAPFYKVNIHDLGANVIKKAKIFAADVVKETYDRFGYNDTRREETIFIGKIAEEVFIKFAHEKLGVELSTNYDVYPGVGNVDVFDFNINGLDIDIKSSKDTKNEGIENCFKYFNFPVPTDQHIKEITVSILYDFKVENFFLVAWVPKDIYEANYAIRRLPVGGGNYRDFYLYPLRKGKDMSELNNYLKSKSKK